MMKLRRRAALPLAVERALFSKCSGKTVVNAGAAMQLRLAGLAQTQCSRRPRRSRKCRVATLVHR